MYKMENNIVCEFIEEKPKRQIKKIESKIAEVK